MKDWINKQYQENISPDEKLALLQFDFTGKSVIDLGCNIGMVADYVFKRGASNYLGIDNNPLYIDRWVESKYFITPVSSFMLKDLKLFDELKSDVIMAIGIFHHLTDKELWHLVCKIRAKTIIIEAPTQGQSNDYNIRSVEQYKEYFHNHELTQRHDSGFKTPPVERTIMVFEKN